MNKPISYVIFDSTTGRILGTHSRINGETGESVSLSDEEVLAGCGVPFDDHMRPRVKVLAVETAALRSPGGLRVNTELQKLVARDHLEVAPCRTEICGDGEDTVVIEIRVLRPSGELDDGFAGKLKVTTERGRLSEPAGIVQAQGGMAKITLRSVAETIDRVRITAIDLDGEIDSGRATVAFV